MARYKHIDPSPRFIAVGLERQRLPGTFEYALNHLIDQEINLVGFGSRCRNDFTDATAYTLCQRSGQGWLERSELPLPPSAEETLPCWL